MTLKRMDTWSITCDDCGHDATENTDWSGWATVEQAIDVARDSDFAFFLRDFDYAFFPDWVSLDHPSEEQAADRKFFAFCDHCLTWDDAQDERIPTAWKHRMSPGSHEQLLGAECICGQSWDGWFEICASWAAPGVVVKRQP